MMTTSLPPVSSAYPGTTGSGRQRCPACLDPLQLIQLEWSFRQWARTTSRYETRLARRRILTAFLLIRHTGATLEEVLALSLETDLGEHTILIRDHEPPQQVVREVPLVGHIAREIKESLENPDMYSALTGPDTLTPSVVRHKFHQRAKACGFPEALGSPEKIRLARAMELHREGASPSEMEQLLGCSISSGKSPFTPARERAGTSQPEADLFNKNLKRNHYPGRIVEVHRDALQSQVILCTPEGHHITAIVSNDSADRLALQPGNRVTAEIKAHAVSPRTNDTYATSSIDNCFTGEIVGINRGRVSWECIIDIGGGTTLYSLVSVHYAATLRLKVGEKVWVSFNSFAVILHIL